METLFRDLRFAIRGLRRTPGFTVAAVLALALGIGATTAIFSVVHAVLLQSLGFGDEQRLVWVTAEQRGYGWKHGGLSPPEVVTDLRAFPLFEASGGVTRQTASLLTDRAERVEILAVTSGFFEALGVQPTFGYEGDPMRLLMARSGAPHHGFMALYTFIEKVFRADAILHVGTHGAMEFMPGKQVGFLKSVGRIA